MATLPGKVDETLDELYSEAYEYELDKREKTLGRLTLPVGAVTLISSGAVFFLAHLADLKQDWARYSVTAPLTVLSVCISVTVFYIVRCLLVDQYRHLPSPQDHQRYVEQLSAWATENQVTDAVIEEKFKKVLRDQKAECIAHNVAQNNKRTDYLIRALKFLVAALVCLCLAAVPYYAVMLQSPAESKPTKVEITNLKEFPMSQNTNNDNNGTGNNGGTLSGGSSSAPTPAPTATSQTSEPQPPPTVLRKEGSFTAHRNSTTMTGDSSK